MIPDNLKDIKIEDIQTVIKLTGTVNTRHIGGYMGKDGRITDDMAFIRSDVPSRIENKDIKLLIDRGIETVIDLRTQDEINGSPVPFGELAEISYAVIPLISDETPPHLMADVDLGNLYIHIIEERKDKISEALKLIARTDGGVFFNCSAGKDRTGVLSMLLLMFGGVGREDIIKDYYFTDVLLQPWIREVVPELEKRGFKFTKEMLEALPEYIDKVLTHMENKYGTVETYAESIGLSSKEANKITEKVLRPL